VCPAAGPPFQPAQLLKIPRELRLIGSRFYKMCSAEGRKKVAKRRVVLLSWERTLGLPVRRLGSGPRARVVAFKDDLQRWLRDSAKANAMQKKAGLLQSMTDLLARGPSSARQICNQCHSPMRSLDGHFWIYGTSEKTWNISVPFCPVCEAETLETFCRSQIIQ